MAIKWLILGSGIQRGVNKQEGVKLILIDFCCFLLLTYTKSNDLAVVTSTYQFAFLQAYSQKKKKNNFFTQLSWNDIYFNSKHLLQRFYSFKAN